MKKVYTDRVQDAPNILFKVLDGQKDRLLKDQKKYGDYISPFDL
jgi:phosphoenolpyruvate carboxykinase (GTP)